MVLTKIYDVRIDVHYDNKWKIQANLDRRGDYYLIGTYKTKERALKVLDDIQDLLQNAYVGNLERIVYEMPKE